MFSEELNDADVAAAAAASIAALDVVGDERIFCSEETAR